MDFEIKLGYDRIRKQVEELCTTSSAITNFRDEKFSTNPKIISYRLRLASQMKYALMMEGGFPSGDYYDLHDVCSKIGIEGAFLEVVELLQLRNGLQLTKELRSFFSSKSIENYPDIIDISKQVDPLTEIVGRIDSIADRFGTILDNASPELYSIRKAIREREGQVSKRLNSILAQARASGIVDPDATLSIRDGRSVIPVAAANKRKLKGFVHDESATGKTVYIEPVEIVEINNELRELEYQQRREIVRILTEVTDYLRPMLEDIVKCSEYISLMDMLRAKGRFAAKNGCVMPIISDEGILELRKARHPLLEQNLKKEGRQIVPLDLVLTRQKHILVISGPNAGGKSVCLKTVGLLQIMFQSGMLVPLLENSQMPVFDRLFVDIGDQQSIDNDLSTYSSHLFNMKRMLQSATDRSLILIDEFGTGTEPAIGGAMAEAILEKLEGRGCYGVITTHYANLKYYASNADGVVNGAMTFDVQNIMPLFKLEMGSPGSSFAIEIARKIGLPEDIIRNASQKAGSGHINIEKQLREIARDKRYWEQKRDRIRQTDRRVEELEQKYAAQIEALSSQRSQIIKQAKEEAAKLTAEANRKIENAIREIRESQADKEKTRIVRKKVDEFRDSLQLDSGMDNEKLEREMERISQRQQRREDRKKDKTSKKQTQPQEKEVLPAIPVAGSKVRMAGQAMVGEVMTIKGKKATVAFGQIMTTVELSKLEVVSNSEFKKQTRPSTPTINVSTDVQQRKLNFKRNIDLRGMRASEALEAVEDFIDDAIMVGAQEVRILHGKGTGALKEEIRRYLKTVDLVTSIADEHVEMGGAGITVVKLDV